MPIGFVAAGVGVYQGYKAGRDADSAAADASRAAAASAKDQREMNQIEYYQQQLNLEQENIYARGSMQGAYAASGVSISQGSPLSMLATQAKEYAVQGEYLARRKKSMDKGTYSKLEIANAGIEASRTRASAAADAMAINAVFGAASTYQNL
jgi:hypothetical protein